jgi:hypothetical protein
VIFFLFLVSAFTGSLPEEGAGVGPARESEAWDAEALCFKIGNGIFESKIFSVHMRWALLNRRNYVRMFEDLNS